MAFQIAEPLEVAEEVVEGLFRDAHAGGEVGWAHPLWPRPEDHAQLWRIDVVEAVLVQGAEDSVRDRFPRQPQESADLGRADGLPGSLFHKST